jgi:DNA primase
MAKNLWKEDIEEAMSSVENLELPKNFRKIEPYGVTGRFFEYMESRGFTEKEVLQVCERYKLKCCLSGDWKDRIIVPIYIDGKLVSWTGRSIHKEAFLRYRNLEVEQSVIQPKHTVFNFDEAFGVRPGDTLYILEGPFDVIKLDYYLRNTDNRAVGMFNMTPTEEQVSLFSDLNDGFKKFIVLLDNGELFSSTKLLSTLSFLGHIRLGSLPKGVKDPGDLTEEQVQEFYA